MSTPEELAQELTKKNQEIESQAKALQEQHAAALAKIEALEKSDRERAAREAALHLDLAKRDEISKYPNLKGFEDLVIGTTKEEIAAKAKILSEKFAARDATMTKDPAGQWSSIPGSSNSGMALPKERADEYASVRANKSLNQIQKLTTLASMHIVDLFSKDRAQKRAQIGLT